VVVAVVRAQFRVHWAVGGFVMLYLGLPILISIPLGFAAGFALLDEEPEQAALVLITMSVPMYALVLAPLLAEVLRAAVSRTQQFRADADAVLLARSAEPLAVALVKMDAGGMQDLNAARSTAHLWTVDPIPDKPWWERLWPDYHPPLSERVEALAGMGSGIPQSVIDGAAEAGRTHRGELAAATASIAAVAAPRDAGSVDYDAEPEAAPDAYRLTAETTVYEAPDPNSAEVETLGAGALITVREAYGEFLHVITPSDAFGYIRRLTPMTPYRLRA